LCSAPKPVHALVSTEATAVLQDQDHRLHKPVAPGCPAPTFRRFEILVGYLKELGIPQYNVSAANFDAVALKTTYARPDFDKQKKHADQAQA
jgi:hypothetical protein